MLNHEVIRPVSSTVAGERADELRAIAKDVIHEESRIALLRVAECYDRMARGVNSAWPFQQSGLRHHL